MNTPEPEPVEIEETEEPIGVLDCQGCGGPAISIYAPVFCWAEDCAQTLCADCNEGHSLAAGWRFIVPPSPHMIFGEVETNARIRCVVVGRLDMSGSRVTVIWRP